MDFFDEDNIILSQSQDILVLLLNNSGICDSKWVFAYVYSCVVNKIVMLFVIQKNST